MGSGIIDTVVVEVHPNTRSLVRTREPDEVRVRLAADPASVPGARRFVTDGLRAWGHDALVEDAAPCVSELAGNAALHAESTFMEISLLDLADSVRVCVEDDGNAPAEAIVPRPAPPDPEVDDAEALLAAEPTTGRGLAIVSILASDWGVESTGDGTLVWAELSADPGERAGTDSLDDTLGFVQPPQRSDARTAEDRTGTAEPLPEGWVLVLLPECPVDLGLQQDRHLDELVRELQLMGAEPDGSESRELAERLQAILASPAHARASGRRQLEEAQRAGRRLVDVEMAVPGEFVPMATALHRALARADGLCAERRLLTLESSRDERALRDWMTEQLVQQTEHGAAPVSWGDWRAGRR